MCPPDGIKEKGGGQGEKQKVCVRVRVGGLREERERIDAKGLLKSTEVRFSTETNLGKIKMSIGTFSFIPERVVLSPLRKIKKSVSGRSLAFPKPKRDSKENDHCHLSHQNGHIET